MQPNRHVLIWAGLVLLLLGGLVVFALVRNQPKMEAGVAITTRGPGQQPSGEAARTDTESTSDGTAENSGPDENLAGSPAASTPTSMSRTSQSTPTNTEPTLTPSGQESQSTDGTETNATEAGTE